MSQKQIILFLLKLCAFLVFIGRAYQFYFFGAPFRSVFWDEALLTPIVEGLSNYSWYDYATNLNVSTWITNFTNLCSFLLVTSAFTCLFWNRISSNTFKKSVASVSLFILIFLGICMVKDFSYGVIQFLELSIQIAICLIFFLNNDISKINEKQLTFWLKIAVAFTFIAHGIFAMGIFYLPGHFIDMTIKILGVSETQAKLFLHIAGILDVLFSILLFVPKLAKYVLIYFITWGILTALARLVSGFNPDFILKSFHNYTYLVIYRLPHGLIPLTIFYLISNTKTIKTLKNEN
ncbi:hypothetical protein BST83_11465 [Polaribacter filamentus]|uniref:Uncharacterized protein n=1 Tax=Polaribacter filamentus TaxID=53483 RepID=A0A2S7KYM5_9FLAO|nr:hypothetical protein [Polaribacter filamentus]PQB07706.1 hypothetical protein BST83_11465 [Polaribacter filamentus]